MTNTQNTLKRTYALVVGIEQYAGGSEWKLNGPASGARHFADWLIGRGVPAANVKLFLSPLDENSDLLNRPGPTVRAATGDVIYNAINDELRPADGDLLYLFWAGHGIISIDGTRRLFCADARADSVVTLNLNSLLSALHTDAFVGFPQQIVVVDACANYIESLPLAHTLPERTFAQGGPRSAEQFVLLGAKPGDLAKNLDAEKTGLFSREVRELLEREPLDRWPPDMVALTASLQRRFIKLREERLTDQTPSFFWYRDWDANEGTLGQPSIEPAVATSAALPADLLEVTFREKGEVVDALVSIPAIKNPNNRETILQQLRSDIYRSIPRDPALQFDVFNTVDTCLNYAGGIQELYEVVRDVGRPAPAQRQKLEQVLQRLGLI
jgi:hypothetical protein